MNDSQEPLLSCREVAKSFHPGTPPVLQDISLCAAPGEFISLIGPSGCGKSTLLRVVAGLERPDQGEIRIGGRPPAQAKADLAFVFQDATLMPWLSARRNVEMPLRLRRVPLAQRQERSASLLRLVGLSDCADLLPSELSGGMKMRVSIARALSLSPRLLLLDEPFGALDEMTRDRLNEDLLALQSVEGWTALFVTHSVSEAVFLSTRVIVMSARPGRIAADLPVNLPRPRTAETRESDDFHHLCAEVSRQLRSLQKQVN